MPLVIHRIRGFPTTPQDSDGTSWRIAMERCDGTSRADPGGGKAAHHQPPPTPTPTPPPAGRGRMYVHAIHAEDLGHGDGTVASQVVITERPRGKGSLTGDR